MSKSLAVVVVLALLAPACGGSGSSPVSPTPAVANYAGTWTGAYLVSGCTQSGGVALANVCGSLGQSLPYRLALVQTGSSVSGSFSLGSISFPSTGGTVAQDGSLTLTGNETSSGITIIATWSLRLSGQALSGNVTQVWTSTTLSGQATIVGTITTSLR